MRAIKLTRILIGVLLFFTLHPLPFTLTNVYAASKGNPPVAHWRFDEGGGTTAYDETSYNNDLAFYHEASYKAGKFGTGLLFDGNDDVVTCASSSGDELDPSGAISASAWVYINGTKSNNYIVTKGWGDAWELRLDINNKLVFHIVNVPGSTQQVTSIATLQNGQWYHVAGTYDQQNIKVYINGKMDNSTAYTLTIAQNSQKVAVGGIPHMETGYYGNGFNGKIDDVRIYNYARTGDQVLVDYNAGSAAHLGAGIDPNEGNQPVLYYQFDENTGTTTYDRSGNNNNGTFSGSPAFAYGKYGTCVKFTTDGDYISAPQSSTINFGTSDFSVVSWANIPKPVTFGSGIFGRYAHNTSYNGCFVVGIGDDTTSLFFHHRNTSGSIESYSINYSLYFSKWVHMAWVKSGTKLYLYLNGQLIQSWTPGISFDVTFANGAIYMISNTGWSPGTMTNLMVDDHKLYNYARTQAQIAYDYNRGAPVAQYKFDEGGGVITNNEYSQASSGAAPVGWWRMDEASWNGTANEVVDSSGNANHGTAAGGVTKATTTSSSKIGPYAGSFDGADDYVTRPTSANLQNNYFTIEAWVYNTRSTPQTGYGDTVFHLDDTGGGNVIVARFSPQAGTQTSNKIEFWWAGGTSSHVLATSYSSNTWYHLAYVKDSAGAKIYVNGANVLSEADNTTVNYTNARNISIGQDQDGGSPSDFFQGRIDDVRIYNYARSAEQVYNDYKTTHGTLVGDTKFADGKIGKALQFDGTGDYVDCGTDSTFDTTDAITVEAWFKASALNSYQRIVSKQYQTDTTTANSCYQLGVDNVNKFRWSVGGVFDYLLPSPLVSQDTWYHLAGTYDRTYAKMYINGQEVWSSTSYTGPIRVNTNEPLTIGTSKFGGSVNYLWNGFLDDARIYNYARTADQVMQDYNSGAARLGAQSAGIADPWGGAMPVAHWKLDENTGVLANDASGNGNNGTLTNGPTWTQGNNGPALSLDGNNDYVDCGDNASLSPANATWEAWIKPNALSLANSLGREQDFFSKQGGVNNYGWSFYNQNASNNLSFTLNVSTTWRTITLLSSASIGTWYHLAATYDGTYIRGYVNGIAVTPLSAAGAISYTGTPSVKIGSFGTGAYCTNAVIDDVRIYNYARTQAQIAWDYNKGKPVGHWRFDESSGATVYDESDNNNNDGIITIGTAGTQTTIASAWTNGAIGKFGKCLSFDGTDDWINIGSKTALNGIGDSITVSAWVKTNVNNAFQTIAGRGNDWRLNKSNSTYQFEHRNSSNVIVTAYSSNVSTDWIHIAGTYERDTLVKLYINGVLVDSRSQAGSTRVSQTENQIGNNYAWHTGGAVYNDFWWNGLIDDVRIYNYARTAEQIQQDYLNGAAARLGD